MRARAAARPRPLPPARQLCKSESLAQAIDLGQRAATPQVTDDHEVAVPACGALARLRDEMAAG